MQYEIYSIEDKNKYISYLLDAFGYDCALQVIDNILMFIGEGSHRKDLMCVRTMIQNLT